jgi:hypothetical protein
MHFAQESEIFLLETFQRIPLKAGMPGLQFLEHTPRPVIMIEQRVIEVEQHGFCVSSS